jgi:hypothetical protein
MESIEFPPPELEKLRKQRGGEAKKRDWRDSFGGASNNAKDEKRPLNVRIFFFRTKGSGRVPKR